MVSLYLIYLYLMLDLQIYFVQLCGCFQNFDSLWAGKYKNLLTKINFLMEFCLNMLVNYNSRKDCVGTQQVLQHQICSLLMTSIRTNSEVFKLLKHVISLLIHQG